VRTAPAYNNANCYSADVLAQSGRRTRLWLLEINPRNDESGLVMALSGRLGAGTSGAFVQAVMSALEAGHTDITIDLTDVEYLSSAGLLALQAVDARLHQHGGRVRLAGASAPARLALELSGLSEQFPSTPRYE
jgi:anti-anti-sigma factor